MKIEVTLDIGEDQVDVWLDVEYTYHKAEPDVGIMEDYVEVQSITLDQLYGGVWLEEGGRNVEQKDVDGCQDDLLGCWWFNDQLIADHNNDGREYEYEDRL